MKLKADPYSRRIRGINMEIITVFAYIGMTINDMLAVFSVLGSIVLLIGVFVPLGKTGQFADWSIGGLIFGGIFQLSMVVAKVEAQYVGILIRMPSTIAISLFMLSTLLLLLRWWLKKNRYRFS